MARVLSLRNMVLDVLIKYGTVGPEGKLPILETWELSEEAWEISASSPDFFVVSDLYNYWSRWNRIEADPWLVTEDLLIDLIAMLMKWPGWCLYMALKKGGLTILSNRILYEGEIFHEALSISDLARRCSSTRP